MRGNRFIDITGQQFGDLTVIKLSNKKTKHGQILWECKCVCGNTTYVMGSSLRARHYKSCGCRQPINRDKGMRKHLESDRIDRTRKSALKAKTSSRNTSGHKGVTYDKQRKKWRSYIGFKGKQISLGYFDNIEDAIKVRKKAEEKYYKPILEDKDNERI